MYATARNRRCYARREITIRNETDACAGCPDIVDQPFVTCPIQHDHDEVLDLTIEPLGDGSKIVGDRRIQLDAIAAKPNTSGSSS